MLGNKEEMILLESLHFRTNFQCEIASGSDLQLGDKWLDNRVLKWSQSVPPKCKYQFQSKIGSFTVTQLDSEHLHAVYHLLKCEHMECLLTLCGGGVVQEDLLYITMKRVTELVSRKHIHI